jgi:hypothetical protein
MATFATTWWVGNAWNVAFNLAGPNSHIADGAAGNDAMVGSSSYDLLYGGTGKRHDLSRCRQRYNLR